MNLAYEPQAAHRRWVLILSTRCPLPSSLVASRICFLVSGAIPLFFSTFDEASNAMTTCLVNSSSDILLSTCLYNSHRLIMLPFRQNLKSLMAYVIHNFIIKTQLEQVYWVHAFLFYGINNSWGFIVIFKFIGGGCVFQLLR